MGGRRDEGENGAEGEWGVRRGVEEGGKAGGRMYFLKCVTRIALTKQLYGLCSPPSAPIPYEPMANLDP